MKTTPKLSDLTDEQRRVLAAEETGWVRRKPFVNALGDTIQTWAKQGELTMDLISGHTLHELPNPDNDALLLVEHWKANTGKNARIFDLHLRSVGGWEASFTILGLDKMPRLAAKGESPFRAITSAFLLASNLAEQ